MKLSTAAALSAVFVSTISVAQTSAPLPLAAPAPTAPVPAIAASVVSTGQAVLRVGTEVPLKLSEHLTTKNKAVRVNQRFRLTVAEDVKVDGHTVIPAGSPAVGEITSVRNKGMWGKSGHIGARVLYVQANGRQIRLSGSFDDKGVAGTGAVVGAVLLLPLAGFFTTGTSADLPVGGAVKAFIDEDVPLAFTAPVSSAPMAVGPAATMPVAAVTTEAAAPK